MCLALLGERHMFGLGCSRLNDVAASRLGPETRLVRRRRLTPQPWVAQRHPGYAGDPFSKPQRGFTRS